MKTTNNIYEHEEEIVYVLFSYFWLISIVTLLSAHWFLIVYISALFSLASKKSSLFWFSVISLCFSLLLSLNNSRSWHLCRSRSQKQLQSWARAVWMLAYLYVDVQCTTGAYTCTNSFIQVQYTNWMVLQLDVLEFYLFLSPGCSCSKNLPEKVMHMQTICYTVHTRRTRSFHCTFSNSRLNYFDFVVLHTSSNMTNMTFTGYLLQI